MRGKRILSVLLVGALCFGLAVPSYASDVSKAKKKVEAAEEEEKEAEKKKSAAEEEQNNLKSEKKAAEKEKEELSAELNQLLDEMEELEEKIDAKEAEIEVIEEQLIQAQIDENDQYEAMKLRIKYMYENGDEQMLEILFDATDISDFLNKAEYISTVSDYDREKLEEYQEIVKQVEEQEQKLQEEYDELSEMQDELIEKQESLETLIATKEGEISDLEDDIKSNEKKIEKLEEAAATAAKKKKEAQEAQADAEARAAASSSSSGSSGSSSSSSSAGESVVSGNGTFTHPCPGYTRISSGFGYRTAPKAGASTNHKGVDFAAPQGTPIYAAEAGTVTSASYSGNAGNLIVINHGNGLQTYYMHTSKMFVSAGQKVSKGQNIGLVGTTGNSTGPHLHFQVMKNGSPVNPMSYL